MLEIFGVDLTTLAGKSLAGAGGLSLIVLGRWFLRAEAIASMIRMAGIFLVLLGVLTFVGVFDFDGAATFDLVRWVARLARNLPWP